jgi:universal stress protein E
MLATTPEAGNLQRLRHILVVIDPTATQHPALARARELARLSGARVELFACNTRRDTEPMMTEEQLEKLAQGLFDIGIETTVDVCSAATLHIGIVRKVLRCDPSLLVKDTHPHTLLHRTWLANTDWQLIRLCPCPLLFVRPGPWGDPPRIAAAVDIALPGEKPAELDRTLLSAAESFALTCRGQLHAVHAYLPVSEFAAKAVVSAVPMATGFDAARVIADRETLVREDLDALVSTHHIPNTRRHLACGAPSDVLMGVVRQHNIDLLVMGAYSRGWIYNVMVGSTTERILDLLPCDVLVMKPANFECPLQPLPGMQPSSSPRPN